MTVKDFIMNYQKEKNIEKHIVKKYIPYANKIAECELIIQHTCYEMVDDKKIFKINTPLRNALLFLKMIDLYTDIDINWNESLKDFDDLSEEGLISNIIEAIPKSEVVLFSSILDMNLDDLMTNTRDLVSFMESKFASIEILLDSILDMPQDDNKIVSEV